MEWIDEGIILSMRPLGENSLLVQAFTKASGRHGGAARVSKLMAALPPGSRVQLNWSARMADQLGAYTVDPLGPASFAPALYSHPWHLSCVNSLCALLGVLLPERHPYDHLYDYTDQYMLGVQGGMAPVDILARYVFWELEVLQHLGFGLDLQTCAATETREDLIYVSPKSGRSVSREAGLPYHDKLLTYPGFLNPHRNTEPTWADILNGLSLTGYFLQRYLLESCSMKMPPARERLMEAIVNRQYREKD